MHLTPEHELIRDTVRRLAEEELAPIAARIDAFRGVLAAAGVGATLRRSRGDDILAACGQLGALAETQTPPTSADAASR